MYAQHQRADRKHNAVHLFYVSLYQVVLSEVDAIRLSSRCRGHVHNARFLSGVRIKAAVTCSNVHGYGALHVTRVDFSMH